MTSSIAGFYMEELYKWTEALDNHLGEIEGFHEYLDEIIRRDTIPNVAAMAEHFLNHLSLHRQQILALKKEIGKMEKKYIKDELPVQNEQITASLKHDQNQLRKQMRKAELSFLGLKYDCDKFVSDSLVKETRNNA